MVKVFGPAMSLDASGSLANTITFSKWKGRNYVRERVIPSNPKSGAQTGRRAMFKFLTQNWAALGAGPQATWQTLADELVASPFNAYVKFNMQNWHNFISPTKAATFAAANEGSDRDVTTAIWEENRIKITSTATTANEQWGGVYHAELTNTVVASVGNSIIVELDEDVASRDTFWTPPSVATWYIVYQPFSDDGALSGIGAEVTAAV